MTVRQFLRKASDARNSARELLQLVFAAELLSPSRCLWIVSPWLRDVPVLDNTTGGFAALGAEFPRGEVRLSLVVAELAARGTQTVIVTRREPGNRQVMDALGDLTGREQGISFQERDELHAKGIVSDRFALLGSMNLTYNGLEHLTELVVFQTDRARVEEVRMAFRSEYGGRA
jgi:phosphatidylserine/phosphatidylglycerophosphate/cardiolipin synthase-like enzyme